MGNCSFEPWPQEDMNRERSALTQRIRGVLALVIAELLVCVLCVVGVIYFDLTAQQALVLILICFIGALPVGVSIFIRQLVTDGKINKMNEKLDRLIARAEMEARREEEIFGRSGNASTNSRFRR